MDLVNPILIDFCQYKEVKACDFLIEFFFFFFFFFLNSWPIHFVKRGLTSDSTKLNVGNTCTTINPLYTVKTLPLLYVGQVH